MVYVLFANGFEEIEGITPVDLLRRAGIPVKTVGIGSKTITGSHGISIVCDMLISDVDPEDMMGIVLPGGIPGASNINSSYAAQQLISYAYTHKKLICAICAAPFVLGHTGLLQSRKAVCYPGYEDDLVGAEISDETTCLDGNIITSKAAGTSFEFSLKIIEYFKGEVCANKVKGSILCK